MMVEQQQEEEVEEEEEAAAAVPDMTVEQKQQQEDLEVVGGDKLHQQAGGEEQHTGEEERRTMLEEEEESVEMENEQNLLQKEEEKHDLEKEGQVTAVAVCEAAPAVQEQTWEQDSSLLQAQHSAQQDSVEPDSTNDRHDCCSTAAAQTVDAQQHEAAPSPPPPWQRPPPTYTGSLQALRQEVLDFQRWAGGSQAESRRRMRPVEDVQAAVSALWPAARVHVTGSLASGLYLPDSDVDMTLLGYWPQSPPPLLALQDALLQRGVARPASLKVLDKASVPLVQFVHRDTGVEVDVSLGGEAAVRAAALVAGFRREFTALTPVALFVRYYLKQLKLGQVFTGGISSYAVTLMTTSLLQLQVPLEERDNLALVLLRFFYFYGHEFAYETAGISVLQGGRYLRKEDVPTVMPRGHRRADLCIQDPLTPGNDVGRSSFRVWEAVRAFQHAYLVLAPAMHAPGRYSSAPCSLLGQLVLRHDAAPRHLPNGGGLQHSSHHGAPQHHATSLPQQRRPDTSYYNTMQQHGHYDESYNENWQGCNQRPQQILHQHTQQNYCKQNYHTPQQTPHHHQQDFWQQNYHRPQLAPHHHQQQHHQQGFWQQNYHRPQQTPHHHQQQHHQQEFWQQNYHRPQQTPHHHQQQHHQLEFWQQNYHRPQESRNHQHHQHHQQEFWQQNYQGPQETSNHHHHQQQQEFWQQNYCGPG